jgi:alpha-glucosidase
MRVTTTCAFFLVLLAAPAVARAVDPSPTNSSAALARADGIELHHGRVLMRVTALTDQIIRVRIALDDVLPEDASWAVLPDMRGHHATVMPLANGFETGAIRVSVDPATLSLTITDTSGRVIVADSNSPISFDAKAFTLRKVLPSGEHIFGLGDKTGGTLDRRGKSYVDWNTDAYAFDSSTDPIYKSIPFFISVGGTGGSYGILLDNSWRAFFDFGHATPNSLTMGAPGGPIDYYIIAGPALRDVVRRYSDLTGKAPLPPQWALGYQQSRYSYMSADELREIAGTLRRDRIPTDVLWLDIDYQDRNRPFTLNEKAFPDLKGLTVALGRTGIKLVTITDLHIAAAPHQGYAPYDTGIGGNHFVHNSDGSVYVGKVWPGPSVFPDFTDAKTRAWWGTNFVSLLNAGVAGFWNDMNEPSVFNEMGTMPLDVVHSINSDDFTPRHASHAEVHNVFGMENTRATYEGVKTLRPNERPFVMTRASYAGGQRYSVTWTGDNSSTWDHLRLMVHQLINLGLSGFSYAGADVGGFTGGPSAALLTRWFEVAAFTPIFRDHSEKDKPRAEPWVDGPEHLAIRRRFVEERYRLMPYLYALADLNARTGDPLMRPVFYDYPDAARASCDQSMAFTLGSGLLIAPPPKMESPQAYDVCLPGGGWYDYWTGRTVAQTITSPGGNDGATHISETPALDRMPVFVRAGTILARQPLVQSTSETPAGPLQLDVYPGPDCGGTIYLDDGHSTRFEKGEYLRQSIRCAFGDRGEMGITFEPRQGRYRPWWTKIEVIVHDRPKPSRVSHSGALIPSSSDPLTESLKFSIPDASAGRRITIEPAGI